MSTTLTNMFLHFQDIQNIMSTKNRFGIPGEAGHAKNSVGSAGSTLFFEFPGNAANNLQKKVAESAGLVGDDLVVLYSTFQTIDQVPPSMEAATAADLAQALEPGLRRLRQQPTPREGGLGGRSPPGKSLNFLSLSQKCQVNLFALPPGCNSRWRANYHPDEFVD